MHWLILAAVVAPLLFAVVNFIDSYLTKKIATVYSLFSFSGLFTFVVAIVIAIYAAFAGIGLGLPIHSIELIILSGAFFMLMLYWYLKAFFTEDSEVSSVIPWFQFISVFALLFGYIFLGEIPTANVIIPIILIIIGAIILSIDFRSNLKFRKESKWALGAAIAMAASTVAFKAGVGPQEIPFATTFFWMNIGTGVTTLIVFILSSNVRRELRDLIKNNGAKVLKLSILNEVLNALALGAISLAALQTIVSKVYAFGSFQTIYSFVLGVIGTIFLPKYVQEDLSKRNVVPKIIAIILVVAGGFLIEWWKP